jgi:DHA1 family multidrug resistance protein-like MFS transporter
VGLLGYGYAASYVSCYNYILNVYDPYASSALATVISLQYIFAGDMTAVSRMIWSDLGVKWTFTSPGDLICLLIPVQLGFYVWGARTRAVTL